MVLASPFHPLAQPQPGGSLGARCPVAACRGGLRIPTTPAQRGAEAAALRLGSAEVGGAHDQAPLLRGGRAAPCAGAGAMQRAMLWGTWRQALTTTDDQFIMGAV